jgi:hypothetical protein
LQGFPRNFLWFEWDAEELLVTCGALKAVAVFWHEANEVDVSYKQKGYARRQPSCFW